MSVAEVGGHLGHTAAAINAGLTKKYTRAATSRDVWKGRLDLPDELPLSSNVYFRVEVTGLVRKRRHRSKQPITKADVIAEAKRLGRDPEDALELKRAYNRINKTRMTSSSRHVKYHIWQG